MMRATRCLAFALATLLLAGCGSFVRSHVTSFHDWPAELPDRTYVFERSQEQHASLEYRTYEQMLRGELNSLGLREAGPGATPHLKVAFTYGLDVRDIREVYPVVTHPYGYYPSWHARLYHDPVFNPLWYGPPIVQQAETNYQLFTRRLDIRIARFADNRPLYEVRVVSEGQNPSLANLMPYLMRSAFKDFPGPNGATRQVELRMTEQR